MHILSSLFSCRKTIDGESAKDRAIAILKRAVSGVRPRRRRSEKSMQAQATPPQDAAAAPAPEPAAQQPNANNASAQNDISIPPNPSDNAPREPAGEPEAPPADIAKPDPGLSKLELKTIQAYQQLKDTLATTPPPLNTKPTDDCPADTKAKPGPMCHICHEPTGVPRTDEGPDAGKIEELAALPCGHLFGHHCLLQWLDLEVGQACPLCRQLPQHSECRHPAMPALAKDAPPFLFKGNPPLPPKCMTCRIETEPGMQMLKLEWQMAEARGLAITSMRQVPRDLHASQMELEWQRLSERTRKVEGSWDEELERVWMKSQKGRGEW